MAFFDDPKFLISHIRHSFISCDDTGMCEAVMAGEEPVYQNAQNADDNVSDLSHSYEIVSDMDIGAHRHRSNTAVRLERLKKERKNQIKTKNVQWLNNAHPLPAEEISEMFQEKQTMGKQSSKRKSFLSEQLERFPHQENNPFNEYAKFDGSAHAGLNCKKINIYLTMLPEKRRQFPLVIIILTTAKIQDLIGLICWLYTNEKKEPKLKDSIDRYSLHIAEDDGEVDLDFPSLDPKENISKFGFSCLALVEKPKDVIDSNKSFSVAVDIPHEGFLTLEIDSLDITVEDLLELVLKNRRASSRLKFQDYHLEETDNLGRALQADSCLKDLNVTKFSLVSDKKSRLHEETELWTMKNMTAMEAPLYQSYTVYMIQKLWLKSEIHLGISGEKIEIDPVKQKGSKFWNRQQKQKPVTYEIDSVAACELEVKYPGKAVFRLTLKSGDHDFRHYDFETDTITANNIVEKMSHILEMRSSTVRREYLTNRERKMLRRQFTPVMR